MPRSFLIRDAIEHEDAILDALAAREQELASYDANVEGYAHQIEALDAALPKEWPEALLKYQGRSAEQIYLTATSGDDVDLAVKLAHRDRLKLLLFTEKAERHKTEIAHEACCCKLPTDPAQLKAAIDRCIARREARKAQQ